MSEYEKLALKKHNIEMCASAEIKWLNIISLSKITKTETKMFSLKSSNTDKFIMR